MMLREAQAREARRLREAQPELWTRKKLAERYGIDVGTLDRSLQRVESIINRANVKRRGGRPRLAEEPTTRRLSEGELRRMIEENALAESRRDLTASFFGDPPPGRSALDMRRVAGQHPESPGRLGSLAPGSASGHAFSRFRPEVAAAPGVTAGGTRGDLTAFAQRRDVRRS